MKRWAWNGCVVALVLAGVLVWVCVVAAVFKGNALACFYLCMPAGVLGQLALVWLWRGKR